MTTETKKITASDEAWESGELGRDEQFVAVDNSNDELVINESLGLQMISIRLQKALIEDLKMISELNGLGYQPLIRQVLTRFVDAEKKALLRNAVTSARATTDHDNPPHQQRA
ncbi:hypothetical protein [Aeromonas rivipollensis]|uniref:hypothetical protein n=1 Tax=Aeromonas rivipollensis TaxID=948519 RepID=UPI00372D7AA0